MTNITLAKESDLNAVYQLSRLCIKKMREDGIEQWDEFYPNIYTFENDISDRTLFVYHDHNILAGCIVINEKQEPEYKDVNWQYSGTVCVIHRLMINPDYQGRGIAKELMHFAEYLAAERNFHAIRLDAFSLNNRALEFYRRLGYQQCGEVVFRKGKFICFEKKLN